MQRYAYFRPYLFRIEGRIWLSPCCDGGRRREPSGGDRFLQKKQYSVREQFYQHLTWHSEVPKTNSTITITIPTITTNIINLNFASDMLHFIWPWAWRKRNITGRCKKGFIAVMKPCETPSPIILWSQLSCCLGMDISYGLMTTITNLCIQQKLKVIICYPAKKLSTNWYLHRIDIKSFDTSTKN